MGHVVGLCIRGRLRYCVLRTVYCVLFTVHCSLFTVCSMFSILCYSLLHTAATVRDAHPHLLTSLPSTPLSLLQLQLNHQPHHTLTTLSPHSRHTLTTLSPHSHHTLSPHSRHTLAILSGLSFRNAGTKVWELFKARGWSAIINDDLVSNVSSTCNSNVSSTCNSTPAVVYMAAAAAAAAAAVHLHVSIMATIYY
jgi:hypothetical protein